MTYPYRKTVAPVLAMLLLALAGVMPARAALQVNITQSSQRAVPIAVSPFGANGRRLPVDIARVASDDLESTGLFKVFARQNMVATPSSPPQVNYGNWRAVGVDNLVVGTAAADGHGGYRLRFDLLDVYQGRSVAGFQVDVERGKLRDAAHTVANLIYEKFTGNKGYFLSRIAYITMAKESGGLRYRLIVSDYDGSNPVTVYTSRDPIMSPAWSPDGSRLAYVAFNVGRGRSSLRVQNLSSGHIREISSRAGINGAPAWSPDGNRLAMTLSYQGDPDIYVYDMNTDRMRQLTHSDAIDTQATWSPDGRYIAFTSDRGGDPQIYRMHADGSRVERITFAGKSNQNPVYSPDGKYLGMVRQDPNGYRIALENVHNNNIRIVSDGPLDDSPSFAPNGQAVIYSKQGSRNELATVAIDGDTRSRLSQSGAVRQPAWGPSGY